MVVLIKSYLLIILSICLAYSNCFQNPFIFDDLPLIVDNPHIRNLSPAGVLQSTDETMVFPIRPLIAYSFSLNYAVSDLSVWSYHLVNLMIHIATALVLFHLLIVTFGYLDQPYLKGKKAIGVSLGISMVWALHPVQTQAVTYITQRAESLMGFFYLFTLFAAVKSFKHSSKGWAFLSISFCALGALCKSVIVTVPLMVILYDRLFLFRSYQESFKRRYGLYVGYLISWLVIACLLWAYFNRPVHDFMIDRGLWDFLLTKADVLVHYIILSLWPSPLTLDYIWPLARSFQDVGPEFIVILFFLSFSVWALIKNKQVSFLGIWFFLILAPTNSFLPTSSMAFEHQLYLPVLAVIVGVILGACKIIYHLGLPEQSQKNLNRCLLVPLILLSSFFTFKRNQDYSSEISIWKDTVAKQPANDRALASLGIAHRRIGDLDEAIKYFNESLKFKPSSLMVHAHLGNAYIAKKEYDLAIKHLSYVQQKQDWNSKVHYNLGRAYASVANYKRALSHFTKANELQPNHIDYLFGLALIHQKMSHFRQALAFYNKAIKVNPSDLPIYFSLAQFLSQIPQDELNELQGVQGLLEQIHFVLEQLQPIAFQFAQNKNYKNALDCARLGQRIAQYLKLDEQRRQFQSLIIYFQKLKNQHP